MGITRTMHVVLSARVSILNIQPHISTCALATRFSYEFWGLDISKLESSGVVLYDESHATRPSTSRDDYFVINGSIFGFYDVNIAFCLYVATS